MHSKEKQYTSKKLLSEHENLHLFIVKKTMLHTLKCQIFVQCSSTF